MIDDQADIIKQPASRPFYPPFLPTSAPALRIQRYGISTDTHTETFRIPRPDHGRIRDGLSDLGDFGIGQLDLQARYVFVQVGLLGRSGDGDYIVACFLFLSISFFLSCL
jgi:hypothetical protein